MNINFKIKRFNELDIASLYHLLRLRSEVFVVEQNCVYQDVDGLDVESVHVLGYNDKNLICYARIIPAKVYFDEVCISRVIVHKEFRSYGYGHLLMKTCIDTVHKFFNKQTIEISAQAHLSCFYSSHEFVQISETYLEDGIPHIRMLRKA